MSDFPSPQQVYPFMTQVSDRRPVTKLHSNIGHAKNALNNKVGYRNRLSADVKLYAWNAEHGAWVLLYEGSKGESIDVNQRPWSAI